MDRNRYYDLYLAESQEHLRALSAALIELERGGGSAALEQAFRAAHTLKGMAAAMGYGDVARAAHRLEDALDVIRRGERPVSAQGVDELLALADGVEDAVARAAGLKPAGGGGESPEAGVADAGAASAGQGGSAAAQGSRGAAGGPAATGTGAAGGEDTGAAAPGAPAGVPDGTTLVAVFRLTPETAMKAARAFIILRRLEAQATVLGTDPATITDSFAGELHVFLGPGAQADVLEETLRGEPDILYSEVAAPGAVGAIAGVAPTAGRFLHVDLRRLDELADGVAELGVLQTRLATLSSVRGDDALADLVGQLARRAASLQETVLALRMVPLRDVFDRFPRVVRDTARATDKRVEFRIHGADIELDRAILDALVDPLVHLLRNAVDHGIESPAERRRAGKPAAGRLWLEAEREQSRVLVRVRDDGRGVARAHVLERARAMGLVEPEAENVRDADLLRILSRSGFSTVDTVSAVSGRGVGLDIVVDRVRALGGSIDLATAPGEGTTFTLWLPLTLAVTQALRVRVAGEDYVIPLTHVAEAIELADATVAPVRGRETIELRGQLIPLVRLRALLQTGDRGDETAAVIATVGERRAALAVDELVGREQILLRGFDAATGTLPIFSGVTLLADGQPALVLDPVSVL